MLTLLTAPVTNDRGPRYMERALAAIHQADTHGQSITFLYGSTAGRVGLFVQCADHLRDFVAGPIAAHYPNCTLVPCEGMDDLPPGWTTWSAELDLTPELFPILRHAQFEDLLNGIFADPITGILAAVQPTENVRCHVAIRIVPARRRRERTAAQAIRLLDREFFRRHSRLAAYYAEHISRRRWLGAWLLGLLARQSPRRTHTALDTTASRLHDREEPEKPSAAKRRAGLQRSFPLVTSPVPTGE